MRCDYDAFRNETIPYHRYDTILYDNLTLTNNLDLTQGRVGTWPPTRKVLIFYLSKLWKAKFSIQCDVIFLVRLQGKFEIEHSWEWRESNAPHTQRWTTPSYNWNTAEDIMALPAGLTYGSMFWAGSVNKPLMMESIPPLSTSYRNSGLWNSLTQRLWNRRLFSATRLKVFLTVLCPNRRAAADMELGIDGSRLRS